MPKKAYYAERRKLIYNELRARIASGRVTREQREAEYRLRYSSMNTPAMLARYGALVDVPVWLAPEIEEIDEWHGVERQRRPYYEMFPHLRYSDCP